MKTNNHDSRFYVYILLDPRPGVLTPFYVGKGSGRRKTAHLNPSSARRGRNPFKNAVIKKIRDEGLLIQIFVVSENITETVAFDLEKTLIKRFGRRDIRTGILTNLTDGGEGMSGISEERRQQLRERMTGSGSPTFGIGHTEEAKKKMSEAKKEQIKRTGPNRHSEEWKNKLKENNPGGKSLRKSVVRINENGEVVDRYESVNAAINATGISPSYMNKLVRPFSVAMDGYIYRHADHTITDDELQSCFVPKKPNRRVGISKVSPNGDVIVVYDTIRDAANDNLDVSYRQLWIATVKGSLCCGYYWKRA